MLPLRDSWDDCYALAEQLKRQSLKPSSDTEATNDEDLEQATSLAIEDLRRRAEQMRKRYGKR